MVLVEGVVDGFLDACGECVLLLNEHPEADFEVDAALAEVGEGDGDGAFGLGQWQSGLALALAYRLDGLGEEAADLFDIGAVGHADGYLDEFVAVVAGEVLEVLAEEGLVEEGDDAAVECDDLCALVGDALDAARDAVALDVVAHAQSAGHKRETVEEVLDEVLHGEAETGCETCGDDADAGLGDMEDDNGHDEVDAPGEDSDDVARQGEALAIVVGMGEAAISEVETADGVVEVTEYEPQGGDLAYLEHGYLYEVGLVHEVVVEGLFAYAGQLEYLGCPVDADEHGEDGHDGHKGAAEEVVGPGLGDVLAALHLLQHGLGALGEFLAGADGCPEFWLDSAEHVAVLEKFH